jgi:hypothetical protein
MVEHNLQFDMVQCHKNSTWVPLNNAVARQQCALTYCGTSIFATPLVLAVVLH